MRYPPPNKDNLTTKKKPIKTQHSIYQDFIAITKYQT